MSEMYPLVSVLIPFYNCSYVAKAIESALNQNYPNVEIIVINDGATLYQQLIKPYLTNIKYIEQGNGGVASALNTGITKALGQYVAWLSSDDIFHPNKLKEQVAFMQERNSSISATNFNLIDGQDSVVRQMAGKSYQSPFEVLQDFLIQNPVNGCTVIMSKEVIQKVGLFNTRIRYAQDYEYWARVALHFPIHYLNKALTDYRIHPTMGSKVFHREQLEEFTKLKAVFKDRLTAKINSERRN